MSGRYHYRLNTRSSGMSSVYQLTNDADTERGEPLRVDKILKQIDENINTFTITQLEELREKVKKVGYNNI